MPVESPWARRYDVVLNVRAIDFSSPPAAGATFAEGPFTVEGTVYPVATVSGDGTVPSSVMPVGTARSTGWITDARRGDAVTTLVLDIDTHGQIILSGMLEGTREDTLSILGGNGAFKDARGEAWVGWYNRAAGAMRVVLNMATI
jgi:hypothetical protein